MTPNLSSSSLGDQTTSVDPDHLVLLEILDGSGLRSSHKLLWFAAAGGMLLDGLSVFMLGIAIPFLVKDFHFTSFQLSLTSASLLLGAVLGAFSGGRFADKYGRKTWLLVDSAGLASAALVSALASGAGLLIIGQFLMGMAVGMDFPVGSSEIAECMPVQSRSRAMVAAMGLQAIGMLTGAGASFLLLEERTGLSVWRLFFLAEALLAVVFLILRFVIPESPRWLMAKGRNREAARAIRWIVRDEDPRLPAAAERLGETPHVVIKPVSKPQSLGFRTLFDPAYLRRTLLASVPWFMLDVAAYGVGLFTIVLLEALHLGAGQGGNNLSLLVAWGGAVDSFLLAGFLLGWWAVPRWGAVRMQLVGFAGMLAGLGILAISTIVRDPAVRLPGFLTGFMLFNLSMNAGPNSTTYLLPSEVFPTNIRGTGAGFSASLAKLGAVLGVFLIPLLQASGGMDAVLALLAVVTLLGFGTTVRYRVSGLGRELESHHGASTD